LDRYAANLRAKGIPCIGPTPGSRTRPDGQTYRWKTVKLEDDEAGILPFHIEWAEDSPHPASDAPGACLFRSMARIGQVIQTPPPGPGYKRKTNPSSPAQLQVIIAGSFGEFTLNSRAIPSEHWTKSLP
ncbi:MAG TPA: VOC family protein, partial [Candidatus Acidoferrum sp.]